MKPFSHRMLFFFYSINPKIQISLKDKIVSSPVGDRAHILHEYPGRHGLVVVHDAIHDHPGE